jgi:hypothetical protein
MAHGRAGLVGARDLAHVEEAGPGRAGRVGGAARGADGAVRRRAGAALIVKALLFLRCRCARRLGIAQSVAEAYAEAVTLRLA